MLSGVACQIARAVLERCVRHRDSIERSTVGVRRTRERGHAGCMFNPVVRCRSGSDGRSWGCLRRDDPKVDRDERLADRPRGRGGRTDGVPPVPNLREPRTRVVREVVLGVEPSGRVQPTVEVAARHHVLLCLTVREAQLDEVTLVDLKFPVHHLEACGLECGFACRHRGGGGVAGGCTPEQRGRNDRGSGEGAKGVPEHGFSSLPPQKGRLWLPLLGRSRIRNSIGVSSCEFVSVQYVELCNLTC